MSKYKDKIKKLPRVTLDTISEVCRGAIVFGSPAKVWKYRFKEEKKEYIEENIVPLYTCTPPYCCGVKF